MGYQCEIWWFWHSQAVVPPNVELPDLQEKRRKDRPRASFGVPRLGLTMTALAGLAERPGERWGPTHRKTVRSDEMLGTNSSEFNIPVILQIAHRLERNLTKCSVGTNPKPYQLICRDTRRPNHLAFRIKRN